MGFSIVVFEGSLVQAGLAGRGPNEKSLFYKLTQVIDIFLILFVALRFAEIVINDKSEYLSEWNRFSIMFWSEIALMIFPLLVFHWDKSRRDSRMLFLGALSMLLGAALWRLDYSLLAFNPGNGYHYFPSAEEVLISLGFVAIEVCAYLLLIRLLPVLPSLERVHQDYQARGKANV